MVKEEELKVGYHIRHVVSCQKTTKSQSFYSAGFNNNTIRFKKKSLYYVIKSLPFKCYSSEVNW
jgi:hypothetical protein